MDPIVLALLIAILVGLLGLAGAVAWLIIRVTRPAPVLPPVPDPELARLTGQLTGQLDGIQKQLDGNLQSVAKQMSVFGEVRQTLGKVEVSTAQVAAMGSDINKLQTILNSGIRKGGFGEVMLETLLGQLLPTQMFETQYEFKDRKRVDAVVRLSGRLIPIDAKFPMTLADDLSESKAKFAKSVRDVIDQTREYIRTDEGTMEFAMMYVPVESIYYEIISNSDLFDYAMSNHVIPASPNSFYAYLQVVVFGLRGMQIEQRAQQIRDELSSLRSKLGVVQDQFGKLGKHLDSAQKAYAESDKKLDKFSAQLEAVRDLEAPDDGGALPDPDE